MRLPRELAERIVALGTTPYQLVVSAESAAAASQFIARLETVASIRSLTALLEPVHQVKVSSLAHA